MKAGTLVAPGEPVAIAGPARRFVSRAGEKLDVALDRFDLDVSGRRAIDVGASTGGFTDVLLRRGVEHVVAVDVGYGQLDWTLRNDPRVTVLERTNARDLAAVSLPYRPDLLTADVSFISLRTVMPALGAIVAPGTDEDAGLGTDLLLLVKPQFEAGRQDLARGGVVRDPAVWAKAVRGVVASASQHGFTPRALMASPVLGPAGNVEFLLHSGRRRGDPGPAPAPEPGSDPDGPTMGPFDPADTGFAAAIERAIAEGVALRDARARPRALGSEGGDA